MILWKNVQQMQMLSSVKIFDCINQLDEKLNDAKKKIVKTKNFSSGIINKNPKHLISAF